MYTANAFVMEGCTPSQTFKDAFQQASKACDHGHSSECAMLSKLSVVTLCTNENQKDCVERCTSEDQQNCIRDVSAFPTFKCIRDDRIRTEGFGGIESLITFINRCGT